MPRIHLYSNGNKGVEVRVLQETDLPAAVTLAGGEHWNQTEQDWKTLLRLSPESAFAAFSDGKLVGTVTSFKYGRELAWIGMMLVQREFRGCGIGRCLMQTALRYLDVCGVSTVKLDATPAGQPLYASLGFSAQTTIYRWEAIVGQASLREPDPAEGLNDFETAILTFDELAFGINRRALLIQLIKNGCVVPAVIRGATQRVLRGYGLARLGADAFYIGPIAASDANAAMQILDSLLSRLSGRRVCLDCHQHSASIQSLLAQRGFSKQRVLTRMSYGKASLAGVSALLFASAAPELG
jgi:predicted GNAT family N-acyltransferase